MPIIIYFQFFKAILSFCLSNSYLCNPPGSPPYRGCLESVIHVYIYHLLHHQYLDSGGPVLLPPIVRIMSASHLQAVLRVSISINNVDYFHLISPYWHQSYSCMCVWYIMKRWWCLRCCVQVSVHYISLLFSLIIHSSVPRWHIVIFTHIWLFDEQNNDLQLSSVKRFLANGTSKYRTPFLSASEVSVWFTVCFLFYYSCFLIDQICFFMQMQTFSVFAQRHT